MVSYFMAALSISDTRCSPFEAAFAEASASRCNYKIILYKYIMLCLVPI